MYMDTVLVNMACGYLRLNQSGSAPCLDFFHHSKFFKSDTVGTPSGKREKTVPPNTPSHNIAIDSLSYAVGYNLSQYFFTFWLIGTITTMSN